MGEHNEPSDLGRDRDLRAISTPDTLRRDALARNLCARVCSERRIEHELEALDQLLAILEHGEPTSLEQQLERDTFIDEPTLDAIERAKRTGWTLGMRHALSVARAHRGLTELRRQASWLEADRLGADLDALREQHEREQHSHQQGLDLRVKHALTGGDQ